jgi:dimethylglycine dehydrogenase
VSIRDLSSFAKFDVSGSDAQTVLNRLCANTVSRRDGGIVLAHALSTNGRIESEFTISRLGADRFYLLSAAAAELRDYDLLTQGIQSGEDVTVTNVTDDYGVVLVVGPRSREILAKLTNENLDNHQFPWLTGREMMVAGVNLIALRINFVGELGWELHMPVAQVERVYDRLWTVGKNYGIADLGGYAVNSLRLEKAYAGWGDELTGEITMIEAGMERFVDFDKGDFIGRGALAEQLGSELKYRLVYLEVMAEDADVRGGEPVLSGDNVVGVTTSGGYGHTVGKSLAFAYVQPDYAAPGTAFEIIILGQRRPSKILSKPAYDPENLRLKS